MSPPRLFNGRFPPGCSGNPGGRPARLGELVKLAREHTAEAIATLAGIMANPAAPAATRVAAAALLDRAWGKPLMPLAMWTAFPAGHVRLPPHAAAKPARLGLKRGWPDVLILHAGRLHGLELKRPAVACRAPSSLAPVAARRASWPGRRRCSRAGKPPACAWPCAPAWMRRSRSSPPGGCRCGIGRPP
jgi:hypothetical protein